MFATTSAAQQTQTAAPASPRHLHPIPVGSKRRQGALVPSSPVARGCFAATTSNAATSFGAAPSISTPIHFTKCFKTGADAPSTGVKYAHARSKSLDECGVSSSDKNKNKKHVFANAGGLDSPLRSRRALPSLSVGAANNETLKGRPGIVYINGTKMPQDGWYQRCFGCGMWTAQSVRLGQFEVFRCKCCAREFRSRAKSMSDAAARCPSSAADSGASADADRRRGGATTSTTTTCSSEEASQTLSSSSLLTSDTATTVSTRGAPARRRSLRGVSSSSVVTSAEVGSGAGGTGDRRVNPVAAARRAMRRSVRANRWRSGESATAAGAELPPLHPTTSRTGRRTSRGGSGGGGDSEMLDAVEDSFFADSSDALHHHQQRLLQCQQQQQQQQQRGVTTSDAEVLTSLVSKLRDFLVVNMPQNSVENSILLRRVESATPSLAYS